LIVPAKLDSADYGLLRSGNSCDGTLLCLGLLLPDVQLMLSRIGSLLSLRRSALGQVLIRL